MAQLYFSTLLEGPGKGGIEYGKHGGFCQEMQRYSDVCHASRPGYTAQQTALAEEKRDMSLLQAAHTHMLSWLHEDQIYRQKTVHAFTVR